MKTLCEILNLEQQPQVNEDEWVLVTPGQLFESSNLRYLKFGEEEIKDAVKAIQDTDEFHDILKQGAVFASSPIQLKRGVLEFKYDEEKSYMIYPRGVMRGQKNIRTGGSTNQYLLKTGNTLELTKDDLFENYKRMLKRLLLTISSREAKRGAKTDRAEALRKRTTDGTVGSLNLPRTYSADLILRKRDDIISLEGSPRTVKGDLDLYMCRNLKSLKGGPNRVYGTLNLDHCIELASLEGAPNRVGSLRIDNTGIKSFEGCPEVIELILYAQNLMFLTSLKGLPKLFRSIEVSTRNPISLTGIGSNFMLEGKYIMFKAPKVTHALGILLIKGLNQFCNFNFPGGEIISKHVTEGRDGMIDCQHELIEAGYDEVAKL